MQIKVHYGYNDKPPLIQSIILAIQHILASFNGIIAVPIVVGGALSLQSADLSYFISAAIFCAGIVTLIQTTGPLGIGSRLPCVMGTSFTFVGPAISVGKQFGMAGMLTATMFGSFIETIAGFFIPAIKKLFPRVVTSAVITLIGLSLIPVAADWCAGGFGSSDYGSMGNLGMAFAVVAVILILNSQKSRFIQTSSVFIGMTAGYIASILLGRVDFQPILDAGWFYIPGPLHFGFKFHFAALLPFSIAYLVTTVETIGDLTATARVSGMEINENQLKGGVLADGVGSFIGGLFCGGANTTFTQNIGIISLTRVASRYVVWLAGIILVILGICPKLGALIAVMPVPVLGGAGLIMFGMVASAGMAGLRDIEITAKNIMVYTLSIVTGLCVVVRPNLLDKMPEIIRMLLSSGITTGAVTAILLNGILPEEK